MPFRPRSRSLTAWPCPKTALDHLTDLSLVSSLLDQSLKLVLALTYAITTAMEKRDHAPKFGVKMVKNRQSEIVLWRCHPLVYLWVKLLFTSEHDDFSFQEVEGSGFEGEGIHSCLPPADLSSRFTRRYPWWRLQWRRLRSSGLDGPSGFIVQPLGE